MQTKELCLWAPRLWVNRNSPRKLKLSYLSSTLQYLVSPSQTHEKWFSNKDPNDVLNELGVLELYDKRITNKTRKFQLGFPRTPNAAFERLAAGRGSDEEDLLELNLGLNSGNSGGPLFDDKHRVIGVCCSTLNDAEQISFAVPAYCVIKYFETFTRTLRAFSALWDKTIPLTPAYKSVHKIKTTGAVVHSVHPLSVYHNKIKPGDVIHSINDRHLDCFGLISDALRGCKITMNTTEFIVGLERCVIRFSRKSETLSLEQMPKPMPLKVSDHFKEWCPLKVEEFGPFIFTNLSRTSLAEDSSMPMFKRLKLLEIVRETNNLEEIVIITKIDPNSYVASFEHPKEYDRVLSINRKKIKSMEHLKAAVQDVKRMRDSGEKYFSIKTSSGEMWFSIEKVLTRKRKRSH